MINTRKSLSVSLIVLITVFLLSLGMALAVGEQLPRSLISSGGGIVSQEGMNLHSATGQPAAGTVQNELLLCSGYWCNRGVSATDPPIEHPFDLYLPAFTS